MFEATREIIYEIYQKDKEKYYKIDEAKDRKTATMRASRLSSKDIIIMRKTVITSYTPYHYQ